VGDFQTGERSANGAYKRRKSSSSSQKHATRMRQVKPHSDGFQSIDNLS
jgi:hypothetical protein